MPELTFFSDAISLFPGDAIQGRIWGQIDPSLESQNIAWHGLFSVEVSKIIYIIA